MHQHIKANLIAILLITPLFCIGQKQGNIWYFGDHAGLDFSSGSPVAISDGQTYLMPSGESHSEGTSIICDSSGSLLLYSNGEKVWNRNHEVMPNGDNLMGHISSTQATLIVPKPKSSDIFYVFTTDAFYINHLRNGLRYSVVDMCLDDGLGDIVAESKNILLLDTATEKLTAVRHANKTDYWIIAHKYWSDAFYAYHLTSIGIVDTVVSHIGSIHQHIWVPTSTVSANGQLRVSPDGTKIALCFSNTNPNYTELFDFNSVTGEVTNFVSIPDGFINDVANTYGVEFSPDNTKLYFTGGEAGIIQYDLTAGGGNPNAIINSKVLIANPTNFVFGMQLGPDGKIYVAQWNKTSIGVINNPNAYGTACNFVADAVSLNNRLCSYGIPNFVSNFDYNNNTVQCPILGINQHSIENLTLYPNPASKNTTFEFENESFANCTLLLFNAQGQIVLTRHPITSNKVNLNLTNLSNGIYFIQLSQENQILATGKLLIADE